MVEKKGELIMMPFSEYASYGLSVIPIRADDKRTSLKTWSEYRSRIATVSEISEWRNSKRMAIVCGAVSGNLLCLDFDVKYAKCDIVKKYRDAVDNQSLMRKIVMEQTPSGGWHLIFRCSTPRPSEKIARDIGQKEAMIETKGEGGYFVCAPSPQWNIQNGSMSSIPTLSDKEADIILNAAKRMDISPPADIQIAKSEKRKIKSKRISPFDDYEEHCEVEDILEMLKMTGWCVMGQHGKNIHLVRPGKEKKETSATLHIEKKCLYVFSSNAGGFRIGASFPARIYATINHNGDFSKAAKQLISEGYGCVSKF